MKKQILFIILIVAFLSLSFLVMKPSGSNQSDLVYSSSLSQVKTKEGNTVRYDYIDEDGNITYASDKHYATLIRTQDDQGRTVLDEYCLADGTPAVQSGGYIALARAYGSTGSRSVEWLIYLAGKESALEGPKVVTAYSVPDLEETAPDLQLYEDMGYMPVMTGSGYAIIHRLYDERNLNIDERYYSETLAPVLRTSGYHALKREYDENKRATVLRYYDVNDHLLNLKAGYAIIRRTYDEAGHVETERYFDRDDNPTTDINGVYGFFKAYDEKGRNNVTTYLDAQMNPMACNAGFASVRRTYTEKETIEMYYDSNGNPARLARGHYGVRRGVSGEVYLNANGEPIFELHKFLYDFPLSVFGIGLLVTVLIMVFNKRVNMILLAGYIFFILFMTVMQRQYGTSRAELEVFWSYKQFFASPSFRLEILNNIWLFVPLGTVLFKLYPHWRILLPAVLFSAGIECYQLVSGVGLFEFDDMISNSLGALLGALIYYVFMNIFKKKNVLPSTEKASPEESGEHLA